MAEGCSFWFYLCKYIVSIYHPQVEFRHLPHEVRTAPQSPGLAANFRLRRVCSLDRNLCICRFATQFALPLQSSSSARRSARVPPCPEQSLSSTKSDLASRTPPRSRVCVARSSGFLAAAVLRFQVRILGSASVTHVIGAQPISLLNKHRNRLVSEEFARTREVADWLVSMCAKSRMEYDV